MLCARIIHAERTRGGTSMSSSHHASEMEWSIKCCWRSEQMNCGRAGWTVDYHFSPFASKEKLGDFDSVLTEIQDSMSGRPGQHLIMGGDFDVTLYGLTDYHHVGESIPRPRTLMDTNDLKGARALHAVVAELDLTVTNTWMDADSERELYTRLQLDGPRRIVYTNGPHHDLEKTDQKQDVCKCWTPTGSRQTTGRCLLFFH